jgi:hypothetical protein
VVRWQFPLFHPDGQLDPARLKKAGGRPKQFTADMLLNVLANQSVTTSEWLQGCKNEFGIGERTFHELKAELQKLGRVIQGAASRKWQVVSKHQLH